MSSFELATRGQSKDDSLDGFVFLILVLVITMVRTYSRWDLVGLRGFQADDYLVWFAVVRVAHNAPPPLSLSQPRLFIFAHVHSFQERHHSHSLS